MSVLALVKTRQDTGYYLTNSKTTRVLNSVMAKVTHNVTARVMNINPKRNGFRVTNSIIAL